MNPPNELQQTWKQYRLKCEEWNTEVSSPIAVANKAKGTAGGKGGAKADAKGGGKGGDKGKGDSKGGGCGNTPRGGGAAPPTKDGKANTKGDSKGGGKDGKGGVKVVKEARRGQDRDPQRYSILDKSISSMTPMHASPLTSSKACMLKACGWYQHQC